MIRSNRILKLIAIVSIQYSSAQNLATPDPDSLYSKNFLYLSDAVYQNSADSTKFKIYLNAWLSKAKREHNHTELAATYRIIALKGPRESRVKYADSMIVVAKKTKNNLLIGNSYLTKGIAYYDRKELRKALDNYIQANYFISLTKDDDAIHMVKYSIALTKYHIGLYDEAIAIFNDCLEYFADENDRAYLNTLHSIGLCYNKIGDFENCSVINATGLKLSKEFNNTEMIPYFINSEGINQCSKRNFLVAVEMLLQSIAHIKDKKDFANEAITWFYIGKAYWELGQQSKAVSYFKKVDDIFQTNNYIRADIRESYLLLIDYYKAANNQNAQLNYVEKLLKVNQELNDNKYYLSNTVTKKYDNTNLLATKSAIEKALKLKNTIKSIIIALMLLATIILVYSYYNFRRKYRKKFHELMTRTTKHRKADAAAMKEALLDISDDVIETVIKNMQRFENKKEFLQKDLTQVKLAALLETNTRYIPKIVFHATGKTTIDYMCDLKIEYLVELLKTNSRVRNYTQKALGEQVGFGSTQNFTRAFKSCTGMSPTLFISELKRSEKEKEE